MAMGRFELGLARFGLPYGPFWTCQKFVGRFGLGRFGIDPCHSIYQYISINSDATLRSMTSRGTVAVGRDVAKDYCGEAPPASPAQSQHREAK